MKSMLRIKFLLPLVFGLMMVPLHGSFAQSATEEESPALIGVKMDAEWCPKCKVMNPKLDEVMPEFQGEEILFVKFNMTDDFTIHQTRLLANRLGLSELFEEHKGQTGYMVVVDAKTNEVVKRLNSNLSEEELKNEIAAVVQNH